jgi:hypothetical protein
MMSSGQRMGVGSQGNQQGYSAALVSVVPPGASTSVPTAMPFTLRFGAPMAAAMEQYVDLHLRDISGPLVSMDCAFTPDRLTLTCTPSAALEPRTTYVLHVGGGMMTAVGQPIDYGLHGPGMGGHWLTGGMMMGPNHGGYGWGMMGPGWRSSSGSYGMEFTFTTA